MKVKTLRKLIVDSKQCLLLIAMMSLLIDQCVMIFHNLPFQDKNLISYLVNLKKNASYECVTTSVAMGMRAFNKICALRLYHRSITNPRSPTTDDIRYLLSSNCKTYGGKDMYELTILPDFKPNANVLLFVTGWQTDIEDKAYTQMAEAFDCRGDTNFIIIDLRDYEKTWYLWSALNTIILSDFIANALVELTQFVGPERIRLVGHSLGAHIMGMAGRKYHQLTNKLIRHITGLDPAFPCFNATEVMRGLEQDSAQFVDVIHTNPGILGQRKPSGHADFYPGGLNYNQAGCVMFTCSHSRAWQYFRISIMPGFETAFVGRKCNSLKDLEEKVCNTEDAVAMGFAVPTNAAGIYYVPVEPKYPFAPGYSESDIPKQCVEHCKNEKKLYNSIN